MSVNSRSVCLQINVAPSDIRHAIHTIPHQLRALGDQVSEIQFTLDTSQLRTSKYRFGTNGKQVDEFRRILAGLRCELDQLCSLHPRAYVAEIDYSSTTVLKVSEHLRLPDGLPIRAYNGSPFYGYVFGLYTAQSEFVLHIDADMLFGGSSRTWISEAIAVLEADPRILVVNPLAGPPRHNGTIDQKYIERVPGSYPAFTFDRVSSRIYLVARQRILFEYTIPVMRVRGKRQVQALINNVPAVYEFEVCLSRMLVEHGLARLDMLGEKDGLWTLHPVYRSEQFYARLPQLIARIEAGDVPDEQRGDYDVNDSMIDWADVRRGEKLRRARRYFSYAVGGILERAGRR